MENNTLEIFVGENICTLGCKHCPHSIKRTSKTSKSGFNSEQEDVITRTQSILKQQDGGTGIMLFNDINNSEFELPFEPGFQLDYFLANLGNIEDKIESSKFLGENYFNRYTSAVIDSINKVLTHYTGAETIVRYGVTLEKNIFDPKLTNNADFVRLTNLFFYIFFQHKMGYIDKSSKDIIEFVFGSNNINTKYFHDSLPYNYKYFEILIEAILESIKEIIGYTSLSNDYGILRQSKDESSIGFSRDDLSVKSEKDFTRSRFSYRVLPDKFSSRDTNIINSEGNNLISIHPDSVQLQHHSHNVNNTRLWFDFPEFKDVMSKWEQSQSSQSFYEICMTELEKRGVKVIT